MDEADKTIKTVKKKKLKTAKKHKNHHIEHTTDTDTIDETQIIQTSKQALIEHTAESSEQIIKQVSLEIAPEHTETIVFDEQTLPIDIDIGPKPIEIQPLFHATHTRAASILENETHIHAIDTPTHTVSINVSELTPLIVSQIDETESVGEKQPDKTTASIQLSSTLITSSATIGDQVIPYDNFNMLETKVLPTTAFAEPNQIPHESKTIYEQFVSQKEDDFTDTYAPNLKQAHETISAQNPIQVHEIDVGESEKDLHDKYEPTIQSATCSMLSNKALNTQETLVQNVPIKFYPEMIIATEEATPIFVEKVPYQTQEINISETENILDMHGTPDVRQAHVEFSHLQAVSMEQTNISESETASSHGIPTDLLATAKDTISLHQEMQTRFSQTIDSVLPSEPISYTTKQAAISLEEMDSKLVETVNVLQNEQSFDVAMPIVGLEASPKFTTREGFSVSEVVIQESDIEFSPKSQTQLTASQTHSTEHTIAAQSDVHLMDTTSEYQHKEMHPKFNAQINFELQKSVILDTTMTHDSEQIFNSKLQTTEPHYSFESNVNNPLVVSQIETKEASSDLTTEPIVQVAAKKSQEPYKAYEQTDEQMLDTAAEYRDDEKTAMHGVQVGFELQNSMISESTLAHEVEKPFETQFQSNEPHYLSEPDVKSSVMISEIQPQEIGGKFSPEPAVSSTATATHESFRASESSKDQTFDTIDDFRHHEMHPEHNAQITFELQKSMISETVTANDAEETFEHAKLVENRPQYSISPAVNTSVLVSETQTIDSESSLGAKPTEGQYLNTIDSQKQSLHAGMVAETIPYDGTELLKTSLEKGVSAQQEPMICHEVTVEMSTISEPLDQLDAQKLDIQKKATPGVITKSALNVMTEESIESLGEFQQSITKEQQPNIKHDLATVSSIIIDETIPVDSMRPYTDTLETAIANVSTLKHSAANVDENWPMESSTDFTRFASVAEQNSSQSIVESSAFETSTVITSDTFNEFDERIERAVEPKYSMDEMKGVLTEDIISQENAEPKQFKLTQDTATGHVIHDVEVQHRCEQTAQMIVENAETLQPIAGVKIVSSTKNVSDALVAAKVEEVITSLSGDTLVDEQPQQHHGKIVQESFNVIGQSVQNLPLESEEKLAPELKVKEEYPTKLIEGRASYAVNQTDILEKEMDLKSKELNEMHCAKSSTEQFLTIANTREHTTLSSVGIGSISEEPQLKIAVSEIDRLHESVRTEENIVHEMPSSVNILTPKSVTATSTHVSKKSVQVEKVKTFEKEDNFETKQIEPKICNQQIEDHLKAAVSQVTQIIEQTSVQPAFRVESKLATKFASESDQNLTFESVYLESHKDLNESAHITETPTQAINVIEQFPLFKENTFDDKNTEQLLTKPSVATQEPTELKSAYQESEINTLVNIKTDKKADKITNKKITMKSIETSRSIGIEGR